MSRIIQIMDMKPQLADFKAELLKGLKSQVKRTPPKFFYDERGSELFRRITELDEYYPTRVEKSILEKYSAEICKLLPEDSIMMEFGPGDISKASIFLKKCRKISFYLPVDISISFLQNINVLISSKFEYLNIVGVCSDYTSDIKLPYLSHRGNLGAFFLGSTIGNFEPQEALNFMKMIGEKILGKDDIFIIGVDNMKEKDMIERAYNDKEGITEDFNKNIIVRMRKELGIKINENDFSHLAFLNEKESRIEMHLVAKKNLKFNIDSETIKIGKGEHIITEYSYKYKPEKFKEMCEMAGYKVLKRLRDENDIYSIFIIQLL
ncbi:L-histidine N(alpha)-methyltransferase [Caldiplasma sukawensis]